MPPKAQPKVAPTRPLFVAYYRVSTARQGESGLGLEAQRETVKQHIKSVRGRLVGEYTDVLSGRNRLRPQLQLALALAKEHGAILIVAKLDRLARDASFLLELASGSVPLSFCDLPSFGTLDPVVGRLMLTLLAGFAEFESRRIGQRIREAYEAARRRGKILKMGSHHPVVRASLIKANRKRKSKAKQFAEELSKVVTPLFRMGKSLEDVAAFLNRRGRLTYHGHQWRAANLWRVLAYVGGLKPMKSRNK